MELLLFRHGIAEPGAAETPDAERALTPRGVERTVQAAHGLARIADRPQAILTSPKARAAQTAAIVGEVFDLVPEVCEPFAEGPAMQVLRLLRDRPEERVLLVGHEPWMSRLIELLCTGPRHVPRDFIELKKASCALVAGPIRRDEAPGQPILRWLLPARVLRSLGEAG